MVFMVIGWGGELEIRESGFADREVFEAGAVFWFGDHFLEGEGVGGCVGDERCACPAGRDDGFRCVWRGLGGHFDKVRVATSNVKLIRNDKIRGDCQDLTDGSACS